MPRRRARLPAAVRRTSGIAAASARGTRLVGDRARRPAICSRRFVGVAAGHDHDAPERDGRSSRSSPRAFAFDGVPTQDRPAGPRLSDESLSVRRLPPVRRGDRLRADRTIAIRAPIGSARGRDRRSQRRSCRCRSCCFERVACQDVRPVVERAHRGGRARHARRSIRRAGHRCRSISAGLGRGLRRRRIGEVAVRRTGRRLPLRPAGLDRRRCGRRSPAGRGTRAPFGFETGAIRYAGGIERFQSGTPNVPALYSARGRLSRSWRRSACRRSARRSLQLTRRLMDRRASAFGWRLNTPGGTTTSAAGRSSSTCQNGAPRHRGASLRRQVIVDYRPNARASASRRTSTTTEQEIDARRRDRTIDDELEPGRAVANARRGGLVVRIRLNGHRDSTSIDRRCLGAGTMGHGIAHAAASSGFETCLFDVPNAAR